MFLFLSFKSLPFNNFTIFFYYKNIICCQLILLPLFLSRILNNDIDFVPDKAYNNIYKSTNCTYLNYHTKHFAKPLTFNLVKPWSEFVCREPQYTHFWMMTEVSVRLHPLYLFNNWFSEQQTSWLYKWYSLHKIFTAKTKVMSFKQDYYTRTEFVITNISLEKVNNISYLGYNV